MPLTFPEAMRGIFDHLSDLQNPARGGCVDGNLVQKIMLVASRVNGNLLGGIHPVVTDIVTIDKKIIAYLNGRIVNHVDRLRRTEPRVFGREAGEKEDEPWKYD